MDRSHKNEERFYVYPMNRVVAVLPDEAHVRTSFEDLENTGIQLDSLHVLTGSEGERLLDRRGSDHGWLARLTRFLQRGAYEGNVLQAHSKALRQGRSVVYVPVQGTAQRRRIVGILRSHGGLNILHFRRWAVEQIVFPSVP
ncbi:hypothetical protein ACFV7R_44330 [Streptomyces sp. NPDC059866]|uniref:hypothetical protein n=1 Tax=Streptomyces sp. NPDC059866 TaxID=3346978 RepID=UPI003649C0B4